MSFINPERAVDSIEHKEEENKYATLLSERLRVYMKGQLLRLNLDITRKSTEELFNNLLEQNTFGFVILVAKVAAKYNWEPVLGYVEKFWDLLSLAGGFVAEDVLSTFKERNQTIYKEINEVDAECGQTFLFLRQICPKELLLTFQQTQIVSLMEHLRKEQEKIRTKLINTPYLQVLEDNIQMYLQMASDLSLSLSMNAQ
ncbi:ATP synthase subunit atpH [Acrasis kona]|uniref:ATP synthase subunit atpH n=1 Tax=Acrasis kona TaxID=1008807 RepID=A0AAW2YUA4_9EUKA